MLVTSMKKATVEEQACTSLFPYTTLFCLIELPGEGTPSGPVFDLCHWNLSSSTVTTSILSQSFLQFSVITCHQILSLVPTDITSGPTTALQIKTTQNPVSGIPHLCDKCSIFSCQKTRPILKQILN